MPVTLAIAGDTVSSAVDGTPKRGTALRPLASVAANSKVALLAAC